MPHFQVAAATRRRGRPRVVTLALVAVVSALLPVALVGTASRAAQTAAFTDGFESGDFSAWTAVRTGGDGQAVVQSTDVRSGAAAATLSAGATTGSHAFVRKALASPLGQLSLSQDIRVDVEGAAGGNVPLMRLFSDTGTRVLQVYRQNQSGSRVWIQHSGAYHGTSGVLPLGAWARLKLDVDQATGTITLALNGSNIYSTTSATLSKVSQLQLGNDTSGQAFRLHADNIQLDAGPAALDTSIVSGPSTVSDSTDAVFMLASTGGDGSFRCSLDGAPPTMCRSPYALSDLGAGSHRLSVAAAAGETIDQTPAVWEWNVPSGAGAAVVAAGDIADCGSNGDEQTAAQLDTLAGTVLPLGDTVYPTGSPDQYTNCYQPSWGRHLSRTRPTTGNHEYDTPGAAGYFGYFGARAGEPDKGWYAYDVGTWRVIALNTNCAQIGGCGEASAQYQWLQSELSSHQSACTLAYWHHPRWSSGDHGSSTVSADLYRALYDAGAEVVLTGHDHDYERFAPTAPTGSPDAAFGLRQFVVGTGGKSLYPFGTVLPTSEVRYNSTPGVLRLVLKSSGYEWSFKPVSGSFTDSGTGTCHGAPDDSGGDQGTPVELSDGFESGALGKWSVRTGGGGSALVQQAVVRSGAHAARLASDGKPPSFAYARASLTEPAASFDVSQEVRVDSEGGSGATVPLLRLVGPEGAGVVDVTRINRAGVVQVQHPGGTAATSAVLPLQSWARLGISFDTTTGTLTARLNGATIYSGQTSLPPIAALQIGSESKKRPFTVHIDDVALTGTTQARDTASPETTIDSGPSGTVSATTAEFRFSADEPGSTFGCSLDGAPRVACVSPTSYQALGPGGHTFSVVATDTSGNTDPTPATRAWTVQEPSTTDDPKLLIADLRNRRLLITDFNGRLIWKFDNPLGSTSSSAGPLGVRWLAGNRILATFGTGQVGVIDVATRSWEWRTSGYNGDFFQSPYDAELLPDGHLAVATRFNENGRITVYDRSSGEVVWKHLLSNAHSVRYLPPDASYGTDYPTLLVGGWGAVREVAYRPQGGQNVTWSVPTEFSHDALVVEDDRVITTEGYYIQKILRSGARVWRRETPQEDRRIAVNPFGGYIFTAAESDEIEFRDAEGVLKRTWSVLSDGSSLDYPYGIQVIDYPG